MFEKHYAIGSVNQFEEETALHRKIETCSQNTVYFAMFSKNAVAFLCVVKLANYTLSRVLCNHLSFYTMGHAQRIAPTMLFAVKGYRFTKYTVQGFSGYTMSLYSKSQCS